MGGWEANESILLVNGKDYTPQEHLVYWIQEREKIRTLKSSGKPRPWTDDSIFQTTYFCNVKRENDRVTKWIRENYTPTYFGRKYPLAISISRLLNRPSSLESIRSCINPLNIPEIIGRLEEDSEFGPIWGNAYVITTHGMKMSKLEYLADLIDKLDAVLPYPDDEMMCSEYFSYLQNQVSGFGTFLSAQVVADLKNTPSHPLYRSGDWWTFCAPGPGSLRGLNWIYEGSAKGGTTSGNFHKRIRALRTWLHERRRAEIPTICMQDFQNCLCEYDKYMRVGTGTGRSKRRYAGVEVK